MATSSLDEYKILVAGYLRGLEVQLAKGDHGKIERLNATSDDDLLKKWLWIGSILGGMLFFFLLPAVFGLLGRFIPSIIMQLFWPLLKLGMGAVIIMLCLAIYFTTRRQG